MSTDKYQRLRDALAAGPTPGPWFVSNILGYAVASIAKTRIAADQAASNEVSVDAAYIAAANPDTIAALLDRLKDLEMNGSQAVRWAPSSDHWSSELRRLFGADARDGIGVLEQRLRDAEAERDALREALVIAREYVADEIAYLRNAFRGHEELGKVPEAEADLARIDAALGDANAHP